MRRKLATLLIVTLTGGLLVGIQAASAHQCPDDYQPDDPDCQDTAVYDDWRSNYVPFLDLSDREGEDGEQQRRDAQRWREECSNGNQYRQQCAWFYGGQSIMEYPDSDGHDSDGSDTGILNRPNELHFGYAATHCFLAEGAHDCDRHGSGSEFDTHDSHGGAIYVDVCLTANPDSKYCDDGISDTQAGVTIVDHLDCPTGCFDEYHVVRPLDGGYTEEQMADSAASVEYIASDPEGHLCGYPEHSVCP